MFLLVSPKNSCKSLQSKMKAINVYSQVLLLSDNVNVLIEQ